MLPAAAALALAIGVVALVAPAPAPAQQPGPVLLLDRDDEGAPGLGDAFAQDMTPDGRFVLLETDAGLVPEDVNGELDVYRWDRLREEVRWVSVRCTPPVDEEGSGGGEESEGPVPTFAAVPTCEAPVGVTGSAGSSRISDDGQRVVFSSLADDVHPSAADDGGDIGVYLVDLSFDGGGAVTWVTEGRDGVGVSSDISGDGYTVAFVAQIDVELEPDGYDGDNVFVWHESEGDPSTTLVTDDGCDGEVCAEAVIDEVRIAQHGGVLAYTFDVVDDEDPVDVRRSIRGEGTVHISEGRNDLGDRLDADISDISLSRDGGRLVFTSAATNGGPGTEEGIPQVYLRDGLDEFEGATSTVVVSSDVGGDPVGGVHGRISDDGRWLLFSSDGDVLGDLRSCDDPGTEEDEPCGLRVYQRNDEVGSGPLAGVPWDLPPGATELAGAVSDRGLIALSAEGAPGEAAEDERFHAYTTTNRPVLAVGPVALIDRDLDGVPGLGDAGDVDMSADGRFVVFATDADLLPEDDNGLRDVYRWDRETDALTLVSLRCTPFEPEDPGPVESGTARAFLQSTDTPPETATAGTPTGGRPVCHGAELLRDGATQPTVSDDGTRVAFISASEDLDPDGEDTNGRADLYLADLSAGTTRWISVPESDEFGPVGERANVVDGALSADGLSAAFVVEGTLTAEDGAYGGTNVYRWLEDGLDGTLDLVTDDSCDAFSEEGEGEGEGGGSFCIGASFEDPRISDGAGRVAYLLTYADDEGQQAYPRVTDVVEGGTTHTLFAADEHGFTPGGPSELDMSADGARVVFTSRSSELPRHVDQTVQAYLWTVDLGGVALVSADDNGETVDEPVDSVAISRDGLWVAFATRADNLHGHGVCDPPPAEGEEGPSGGCGLDVFVHSTTSGTTALTSGDPDGRSSPQTSAEAGAVSDEGVVAFAAVSDVLDEEAGTFSHVYTSVVTPPVEPTTPPPTTPPPTTPPTASPTPTPPPRGALEVSPAAVAFGPVAIGATARAPVTATNRGPGPVTITSVAPGDGRVVTVDGVCVGRTLDIGDACTSTVSFRPTAVGDVTDRLTLTSDASNAPHVVAVTGRGVRPRVVVSPGEIDFGTLPRQAVSDPATVTVTNPTEVDVVVAAVTVGGPDLLDFDAASSCGRLAPDASCTIAVTFSPTELGPREGRLEVAVEGSAAIEVVALSGVGGPNTLRATPTALTFELVEVGRTSAPQVVTISNDSPAPTGPLLLEVAAVEGATFPLGGTAACAGGLEPGQECEVSVSYQPQRRDVHQTRLVVTAPEADAEVSVRLAGQGGQRGLIVRPIRVDFGAVLVGGTAAQQVRVIGDGVIASTVQRVAVVGEGARAFGADPGDCPAARLERGQSCTISVTFAPDVVAGSSGVLVVEHTGGDPLTVPLSGEGVDRILRITPAIAPPGFVPRIRGEGFVPGERVTLAWEPGIGSITTVADADGVIDVRFIVMRSDMTGLRDLVATGDAGSVARVPFLVVPGTLQAPDFQNRR